MTQAIHFTTSLFDVSKERVNPINPIYGLSLLEWLRNELKGNIEITEPDAEDWGWYSELSYEGHHYLIGSCAYFEDGDDPNQEQEWVFQVDKYRTLKEKIFGQNKMSSSDSCLLFFKELFEENPNFKDIHIA